MGRRILSAVIIPLFSLTFILLGLLINLVQGILFIFTPKTLFRKLNYFLVYGIHGYLLSVGDWWSNSKVNIYCNKDLEDRIRSCEVREHALYLMNHHTELDWLYSWILGDRFGILGNCRAFAKSALRFVPIVGWSWAMSDMVFLSRGDWENDQKTMIQKLNDLAEFPSPVCLLLFPEGTRFTKEKHKASKEFAMKADLPCLQHHLTPRTKGFTFIMEHVDRDTFQALYDVTLVEAEESAPFNIASLMSGKSCVGNMLIRRIPLINIPKDKEESALWLHNFFKEKDDFKNNFITTGTFSKDCSVIQSPKRVTSLILLVVSNIFVLISVVYCMVTGGWILRAGVLALCGVAFLAIKTIGDSTRIEKSSKYGVNNNKESVKVD